MARLWLWVALLWAAPAAAGDVATEQFREAKELYKAGNYAVALPLFEEALERSGSPNARLYVARCKRELGQVVDAYLAMRRTLADARRLAKEQPKYEPTRDAAAAELAKLDERVGRVVVALDNPPEGTVVTVAGRLVEDPSEPAVVPPGEVSIRAEVPGRRAVDETVTVQAGALETVVLPLEREVPSPAVDAKPVPRDDEPEGSFGVVRGLGVGAAVIGLGGLVAGAVTGAMTQAKADRLEEECGGARCTDPAYAEVVDEGETLKLVTNVSLVAGGVVLAGGVAMILFGGPDAEPAESAQHLPSLWVTPDGATAGYRVRF